GARLPEGDVLAGYVLQLDGDVLEDTAEPDPLVFGHAPDEAARFAIRAAVLPKPRQPVDEGVDEAEPEPHGGPRLQFAQVELEADDREVGVDGGADEGAAGGDEHETGDGRRETGVRWRETMERARYLFTHYPPGWSTSMRAIPTPGRRRC